MILKLGGSAFVYCFFELFFSLFFDDFYTCFFLSLKSMSGGHMWQTKRCADWGLCGESWAQRMERMGKRSGDSKKWKKSMKFTYIYDTKQNKATWKFEMNMNDNRLGKLFIFQQRLRNWERREALRCPMDVQFSGAKNCTFAPFIKAEHAEHSQLWKDEMKAHTVCLRNVSPPMSRHWKE